MDGGSLLPRLLPAPEKQARLAAASAQIQADANIRELRNKVMELEASLRRYNESLRYYTTSALKEAEELAF